MHGLPLAPLIVAASLGLASQAPAGAADAVAEARRRLDRGEAVAAVAILEDSLADAGPSKDAVLGLLRPSYEAAARQAAAAGRPRDADTYRENLRILDRKSRAAPAPPASPVVVPEPRPAPARMPDSPPPLVVPSPEPAAPAPAPADPIALLPMPTTPATEIDPATADAAFAAENYAEAGRIYAALARDKRLPANRRDHWAYCRSLDVARRINAHPQAEAEWASIDAEIDQIRALNPNNWLGEYLRNRASDRLVARKKPKAGKTVLRGSSPEETPANDRPVRATSNTPPPQPTPARAPVPTPARAPVPTPSPAPTPAAGAEKPVGRWQIRETANFRIHHVDPTLAEQVAHAAEGVRREGTKRWTSKLPATPWQPKCDIYLFPTARMYAVETGQPEDSPGFSSMKMEGGLITERLVHLRADHPTCVQAVLPHEVTHVILADHFPVSQIPRWADEGMAVLAEPADEQRRRATDLVDPLGKNVYFSVEVLMGMPYPDQRYWGLYYAQSVSLTRFLVEQGSHAQFLQFLQGAQREGFEAQLRKVYKIEGYADLQARWVAFARANAAPNGVAAAPNPDARAR